MTVQAGEILPAWFRPQLATAENEPSDQAVLNLLNVVAEEKVKGNELAIVDQSVKPVARLVGIL